MTDHDQPARPSFSVVKGSPTDEELAALVAVLRAASAAAPEPGTPRGDFGWSAYWRSLRVPLQPGPGVWRASGRGSL
ncbi:MAG TPA: acyl-CoA carboxylase subunit epsilon [Propionibacteriaceae bacterium]|nr:acyl-CoA carboxylase subunit epsilon [Propionibacteriaceae bacterium]